MTVGDYDEQNFYTPSLVMKLNLAAGVSNWEYCNIVIEESLMNYTSLGAPAVMYTTRMS